MEPNIPGMGLLYFSMSGKEEEGAGPTPPPGSKRRRLRGACAECRQRKIRCDRAKQPGNICSNCIAFNCPCTDPRVDTATESTPYETVCRIPVADENFNSVQPSSGQDSTDTRPYGGKTAAEHVEAVVVQSTAYIDARDLRTILLEVAQYSRAIEEDLKTCRAQLAASRAGSNAESPSAATSDFSSDVTAVEARTPEREAEDDSDALVEDFHGMKLTEGGRSRYFGESSGQHLFRTAEVFKNQHEGQNVPEQSRHIRRAQFWRSPWEKTASYHPPVYTFPPQDLMDSLVAIYFRHWNIFIPLLHRPTFHRAIASGLHLTDHSFGSVVLGVCALGARLSDDPRVILPGTNSTLSAGWEWLQQIQYPDDPEFYFSMDLYGLQRTVLLTLYLHGSSLPRQCWTLGGIALRNLQDLGRHREKRYPEIQTVEDELYRRAFWAFIFGDIYMSAFLGRPRATSEDEHDVDYPTDVDDEYWEHPDPSKRFQQPEGKPSQVAFFVSNVKLFAILGRAEKTIYSLQRNERGPAWSQSTVAELDSALNQWLDSIPEHLRWDPHRENSIFSAQSAALYASYYHVQIQIHRSFIPSPSNDAPLFSSFPSLAICSNAARACSHVMEVQSKRGVFLFHIQSLPCLLDSALVLLVNVWGARQSGSSPDPSRAAADIQRCISCLKMYEPRLQLSGRFCDLLASISNQVLINPPSPTVPSLKRTRDLETQNHDVAVPTVLPLSSSSHSQRQQPPQPPQPPPPVERVISQYPLAAFPSHQTTQSLDVSDPYSMPISTEELGHLPLYPAFEHNWASDTSLTAMTNIGLMFSFADAEARGMAEAVHASGVFPNYFEQPQFCDPPNGVTTNWMDPSQHIP